MNNIVYDKSKLDVLFNIDNMTETINALDNVLFSACMYYLDVEGRGVPLQTDSYNVSQVRFLLETLRSTIVNE